MFCNNCGNKINEGDFFCSKCGVKIDKKHFSAKNEEVINADKKSEPEKKKKSKEESDYDSEMVLIGWIGTFLYLILACLECFVFKVDNSFIWGMLLFALSITDGVLTALKPKGLGLRIVFFVINFPAGLFYVGGI